MPKDLIMRLKARASSLLAGFAVAGCAMSPATLQGYQPRPLVEGLELIDVRSQEDKTSERLSLLITECDYGVTRLGDDMTVPSRLVLLQEDLGQFVGSKLRDQKIELTQYRLHVNQAVELRRIAGIVAFGSINTASVLKGGIAGSTAGSLSFLGSDCAIDKMRGGWYTSSEITAPNSPIIVEIAIRWNGKPLSVRTVHTPKQPFTIAFGKPEPASVLFDAVSEAHVALAAQISKAD